MKRILLAVVLLLAVPVPAQAAMTYQQLARQNVALRTLADARLNRIHLLNVDLEQARWVRATALRERDYARARRDEAVAARKAAEADRDAALAGLPAAIGAVPLDVFWSKVIAPAAAAWNCGMYYSDGGYVSQEFRSRNWC